MNEVNYYSTMTKIRSQLLRKALQNSNSMEDAEDLVQEVMIRLWLAREKWTTYNNWEAVAMQTLKNCVIDNFRKKKALNVELEEITDAETPLQILENKDFKNTLSESMKHLPNLQRLIIRLKDIEGYEIDEISAITQTTPESVRMNLSRARKKIRELYMKIK